MNVPGRKFGIKLEETGIRSYDAAETGGMFFETLGRGAGILLRGDPEFFSFYPRFILCWLVLCFRVRL